VNRSEGKKDYYKVLGASEGASSREIERLYKRLAHLRHPDRGGSEDDMKALNEAYQVLHDLTKRKEYDSRRIRPVAKSATIHVKPTARDVGVYGQFLSALLCILLGLMFLFLVHFNGLWFLWPLSILAAGVIFFGVIMAHSAMTNARESFAAEHPARRFRAAQEIGFWSLTGMAAYGVYLVLTSI
jgi:curved DNA-binding protein CbpA